MEYRSSRPSEFSKSNNEFKEFSYLNFNPQNGIQTENYFTGESARFPVSVDLPNPKTPNVNPFSNDYETPSIRNPNSRRGKRTVTVERPMTAPFVNKNAEGIASQSTGFTRPLSVKQDPPKPNLFGSPDSTYKDHEFNQKHLPTVFEEPKKPEPIEIKQESLTPRSRKQMLLEKEITNAKEECKKALDEQEKKFKAQLDQDLEALEKDHKDSLSELKQRFEDKKMFLINFRDQQEKIMSLNQLVTKHTETISNISQKFSREKEYTEDLKFQDLILREKALDSRENRLVTQIQILDQEKQRLAIKQAAVEETEEKFRKIIEEEKNRLYEEQKSIQDLQQTLNQQDREKKQILALEQHRLSLNQDMIEREEKAIQEEIQIKEKEIRDKEALMDMEKNEAYTQIQYEKNYLQSQISQLENFKKSIPSINADSNKRLFACEEKSKQLKLEAENIRKAQEMLEKDKALFEKEAQKIHQICIEIEKETEALVEQKSDLQKKKEEIEIKRQEVSSIIAKSRQDKVRIDQLKTSLNQRVRVYESLKAPAKPIEIPKIDINEYDLEPIRVVSRPRSVISRSNFKASEYMKDLEPYKNVREDIQNYINYEGTRLLNSKLDYETGYNRALQASIHDFSSPSSSYFSKLSPSIYMNPGSFSKPGDSQYVSSSFYRE
jgi:hypothetical protein